MSKKIISNDINKDKLVLISKIVLVGFLAAIVYHFFLQGVLLKKDYPLNTFLFLPSDRFNDFYNMLEMCKHFNPYFEPNNIGNSNYLPLANIFFSVYALLSKNLSFIIYLIVGSGILYWITYKYVNPINVTASLKHRYTLILAFLSYGFLFCVDRGNLELYIGVFLMLFVFFYIKKAYHISIIFLAIATAMKIYPIIFILLFISDKKYKEVALTVFYSVILIILPIFLQHGSFNDNLYFILNGFELDSSSSSSLGAFDDKTNYMLQGTSLFSALKIANIKLSLGITNMFGKYTIAVAIIALLVSFYVVCIEKILWRKVTLLVCLILILPHISFDYKLVHILLCVCLYINEAKEVQDATLNYKRISILFGILLIPKAYVYFSDIFTTTTAKSDVPIGTLVNPLFMLYLCYLIISNGLKQRTKEQIRGAIHEQFVALKKAWMYVLPLILLVIPYYIFSQKAKKEYSVYKTYYSAAQDNLTKNNTKEALANLSKAYICKPYQFKLPVQMANIYSSTGQWDSAKLYFNKALMIYPESQEATSGLIAIDVNKLNAQGTEALNNKKFAEAETLFSNCIIAFRKMPYNPANQGFLVGLYTNISICQINMEKWKDVENTFKQITALDPNNEFVKNNSNFINQKLTSLP